MVNKVSKKKLINAAVEISKKAGETILEVYNSDFEYTIKEDSSPLTKADQKSHDVILHNLRLLDPHIPILSEEDSDIPFSKRSKWNRYWLVDPLDGTKEFIKRNGEFTVNIALIENNLPVLGVIHIPVSNETFWGSNCSGSFYSQDNKKEKQIYVSKNIDDPIKIATSSSHPSKDLDNLLKKFESYELIKKGSSIKLCLVACGTVDIYLRLGPTSEWDIAAGDAIIKFAGGNIISLLDRDILTYNLKESLLNPEFIAFNNDQNKKRILALLNE